MRPPPQHSGCERVSKGTLSFSNPFTLGRSDDVLPAGDYEVETIEHRMDAGAGSVVHVRTSAALIVRTATGFKCREVAAGQLEDPLARDAALRLEDPSENPGREKADDNG